jgi:hypothetical protein
MATPSSRAVLRRPIWSDSMSRLKGEYLFGRSVGVVVACLEPGSHSLDLNGVDVDDLAGSPESLGADLGETNVLDLALILELLHLPDGLLDRSLLVHAVTVVEVDVLHAEALQRALACFAAVLRC